MSKYICDNGCCVLEFSDNPISNYRHRRGYCKKAGVFIYDPKQDRVLLVQSRGQLWGPPKGTLEIDMNETSFQCAIREVKEETGLNIIPEDFTQAIKIKNRALYYYVEKEYTEIHIQNNPNNDANGITWIKLDCLEKLLQSGQIILNQHCRILFKKFLNRTLPTSEFVKVTKKKK